MTRDAFVIMPFSKTATRTEAEWTETYEHVFLPAFKDCHYACERSQPMTGSLAASIIDRLRCARIVLADITDRNPNVFYELGIRHCLKKGTILAAQGAHNLTSDLMGYWFVNYDRTPSAVTSFRSEISRLVALIEADPEKSDNPVSDYLDKEHINIQGYLRRDVIKKLGALYTELTGLKNVVRQVPDEARAVVFISCDCLKLLCNTMYIDIGADALQEAYELIYALTQLSVTPSDVMLVSRICEHLDAFSKRVASVRGALIHGDYSEPPTVSSMVWVPVESARNQRHQWFMPLIDRDEPTGVLCETVLEDGTTISTAELIDRQLRGEPLPSRMPVQETPEFRAISDRFAKLVREMTVHAPRPVSATDNDAKAPIRVVGTSSLSDLSQTSEVAAPATGHKAASNVAKAFEVPSFRRSGVRPLVVDRQSRNKLCPCGSGRKLKNCCARG
jgi:hypothetical protein